ncbi:MAG: sigma 54-interacting transcriptional regulator [Phycisphaerales bacterium]|nr:MAG: sigma 54-interacting transcriptional regulator [Phycisphaerales bacterium]
MMVISRIEAKPRLPDRSLPTRIVGSAACVTQLKSNIEVVGTRNCTVLICGESGTGKELVAQHIHAASPRAAKPFITVDCTTLRDTLLESQLFGHVKGAFTGAERSTLGLIRAADQGTVLLDEIGELTPHTQAKLLRCIQEKAVLPVGAVEPIPGDVRFIAATHRDLKKMVDEGEFREDLYFRLNVVRLDVPPLRTRPGDIIPLAEHFLLQHGAVYGEPVKALFPDAKAALENYEWPGNVRELRNAIEHACVFSGGSFITVGDLPQVLRAPPTPEKSNGNGSNGKNGRNGKVVPLEVAERSLIKRALRATAGNQTRAAEMLGVERHRLGRMLRRHGLQMFAQAARA